MLDSEDQYDLVAPGTIIREYVTALRSIKMDVLRHISVGLFEPEDGGNDNSNDTDDNKKIDVDLFAKLHNEHNDTLRLITYLPTHSETTGNRCKEHSDYGTITLLSTDGVSGLELFHEGQWLPVPHVEGALVVNVGSLLAGWTNGALRATLHRVAGPASLNSGSDRDVLLEAVNRARTSVAFFVDPNHDVAESLVATTTTAKATAKATATATATATAKATTEKDDLAVALGGMSVGEYIRFRSGGDGVRRSGVSFTAKESEIISKSDGS